MAKVKRTRVKRAKKKARVRPMRTNKPAKIMALRAPPIEKALRDYIALLKDPCNGPLVGPVGATSNGYITRLEKTITINPNQPNWALRWTPGLLNTTAADGDCLYVTESATMTGALTSPYTNSSAPGFSFLGSTATTYRCLAACAQIRYTDTEVNRKGVIGSTISTAARTWADISQAFSITVDRARVPDQSLEVLWQPSEGDEMFTVVSADAATDSETLGRKNSILLAGSSCTTAAISIRLVVVYQWTPQSDDSIVLPVPTPGTGATMARVVQLARQAGFIAGHLIRGYTTGGLYGVTREVASMIRPSIRTMR